MKVPALRRGNQWSRTSQCRTRGLNESPRPKAGKCLRRGRLLLMNMGLNESPRPKAGKFPRARQWRPESSRLNESPRPKAGKLRYQLVPVATTTGLNESPRPKAGKWCGAVRYRRLGERLNESPRPKAGKSILRSLSTRMSIASMKVPALRRGNAVPAETLAHSVIRPQ